MAIEKTPDAFICKDQRTYRSLIQIAFEDLKIIYSTLISTET